MPRPMGGRPGHGSSAQTEGAGPQEVGDRYGVMRFSEPVEAVNAQPTLGELGAPVDPTLCTERAASVPDPGTIASLVGKDMAFLLEAAQAAGEVRSRAQAVRDTIVALLTELTRS